MSLQQCMGGWCSVRDKCAHYWAPQQPGVPPSERLCADDGGPMKLRPVELVPSIEVEQAPAM